MGARRTRQRRIELFEASLASGIGQALAGWAAEYTHSLLEGDPELRAELRRNWLAMFERISRLEDADDERSGSKRSRRGPAKAH